MQPDAIEDVIMGGSLGEGTTGMNIARQIALRAGLPVQTAGVTVNRFCSTGLQTIAMAASRVIVDGATAVVAGGLESISATQNEHTNLFMAEDPWLREHKRLDLGRHDQPGVMGSNLRADGCYSESPVRP